jgi:PAS domain S-box-containing protein
VPDDAVLERTCAFDPASLSASEARRFVRGLLSDADRDEWAEAAELAVSEVVTNVVLHAHTRFDLTVRLNDEHVRVEIRDRNPALPRQRGYDDEATTGRGMALVEAITDAHGITSLGSEGKVVWFCVGSRTAEPSGDDLLGQWDDTGWDVDPTPVHSTDESLVDVTLSGMPPTLWLAARQHHDALLRELTLYRAEHPDTGVTEDHIVRADAARTTVNAALEANLARARLRGENRLPLPDRHPAPLPEVPAVLELVVPVPAAAAPSFRALQDVLDTAERLAIDDALLVRPALPEVIAVRDWACDQVVSQLSGGPPAAWVGADHERFIDLVHDAGVPLAAGWDESRVRDADRGAVAADDANRMVAVSRPLADALGYAVEELVGRRVVTIVPPRFREAHVAGFTRHLSTGQAHVLGVELELPVLCRDGSELVCTFLVEATGTASGRRVYIAWITPPG